MRVIACLMIVIACVNTSDAVSQLYVPQKHNAQVKVKPSTGIHAFAFDLADVKLLPGSAFKHAMDIDAGYMLALEPKRLLSRFYKNAHLPVKDSAYGGWESEGLSGHTLGHYLSACAMMYASTSDARFKQRVDFIVAELARCQDARNTGYVGAIPNEDSIFYRVQRGEIKSGGFDLNGGWSPWYTVHKVMAGLADAYLYCNNNQALTVLKKMADWTAVIVNPLTDEQRQKMLKCEYGGMNELLANLYSFTGEKKYLDLSYKFYDDFVMKPLSELQDPLGGKHSNTNIPKAIGSARQYELTGNKPDAVIAGNLWNLIVHNYSYVTGGNGNNEYLGQAKKLSNSISDANAESCCAYNMLKLTGHLFSWQPTARLGDYYERTLYNDILASQHPTTAMMLYFEPLRMGARKQFSDSFNTFTCCVGTGMEDHAKYTEAIYFEGNDGSLYLNLFIPSSLNWKSQNIHIIQQTSFPNKNNTSIVIKSAAAKTFTMRIRKPAWSTKLPVVLVNGKTVAVTQDENGFLNVGRKWKNNDRVDVRFDMHLYTESMPDNEDRIAMLYGPVVLAGNLGDTMPDPFYGTPVLLTNNRNVTEWAVADSTRPLTFHMKNVGKPFDAELSPFYQNTNNYYTVYWDYFTTDKWSARQQAYAAEKRYQQQVEMQTVDIMRLGEMQPERDHDLQASEESYVSDGFGKSGREARKNGFFSFNMKVDSTTTALLCTYIGDDNNRSFDILIDDVKISSVELSTKTPGKFYDETYAIPGALIKDKTKVRVRVQGTNNKTAGRMFECRTIRKPQL